MSKRKSIMLWVISFIVMATIAIYQRITGPTYPVHGNITINSNDINYALPRSSSGNDDEVFKIKVPDKNITGVMDYRRYKSYDEWMSMPLDRQGDYLTGRIPGQPTAGKVMYQIVLREGDKEYTLTEEPVIIRFKGHVPLLFLIPHIMAMFGAMWFSLRTGLEAIFKGNNLFKLTLWTTILLTIGGVMLGPIIQYYAFGDLWTGWPFGHDLTDNKTAAAFLMWVIALWRIAKKPDRRGWAIAAAAVLMAVYLIPHSVLGSELDFRELEGKPQHGNVQSNIQ